MARLSDATVNSLLDLLAGSGHASAFPGFDAALSLTLPTVNGTGVTEPVGNGYGRVDIPGASWSDASGRQKTNGTAVTFPQPTGDWGVILYYCLYDHGTDTFRTFGSLAVPRFISASSDPPQFAPGALILNAPS